MCYSSSSTGRFSTSTLQSGTNVLLKLFNWQIFDLPLTIRNKCVNQALQLADFRPPPYNPEQMCYSSSSTGRFWTSPLQSGTNVLLKLCNWQIFDLPLTIRTWRQAITISSPRWRSSWLPSASTPTKSSWMEATSGCITWRHRSMTRDYSN